MQRKIQAAPTVFYPESDGKPMAETDIHRKLMNNFILMLETYYEHQDDVYVSGNLFVYYEEGNPKKFVAPDVFVTFGVEKKLRRTFRVWDEGKTPDFVLEVASPKTFTEDMGPKKELYESKLAVKEYFIYDPLGQIVPSFIGYQLVDSIYQEIEFEKECLLSTVLGLELGEHEGVLRLFNPQTQKWFPTVTEELETVTEELETVTEELETVTEELKDVKEQIQQESNARINAERRAQHEVETRRIAEDELAKALAEIESLRSKQDN